MPKRLNIAMPDALYDRMERLRVDTEAASAAEVIRRALAVYEFIAQQTKDDNAQVIVRHKDQQEQVVRLMY